MSEYIIGRKCYCYWSKPDFSGHSDEWADDFFSETHIVSMCEYMSFSGKLLIYFIVTAVVIGLCSEKALEMLRRRFDLLRSMLLGWCENATQACTGGGWEFNRITLCYYDYSSHGQAYVRTNRLILMFMSSHEKTWKMWACLCMSACATEARNPPSSCWAKQDL